MLSVSFYTISFLSERIADVLRSAASRQDHRVAEPDERADRPLKFPHWLSERPQLLATSGRRTQRE